jgi:CBS domain-containing protein
MKVDEVMQQQVFTCRSQDSLRIAAQLMWDHDIGSVVVLNDEGRPIGMVTDRDVLMCLYTSGRSLDGAPVSKAMSKELVSVRLGQPIQAAEAVMKQKQIRRLVVVNDSGKLAGILSLNDLALSAGPKRDLKPEEVIATMASICQPRLTSATARH